MSNTPDIFRLIYLESEMAMHIKHNFVNNIHPLNSSSHRFINLSLEEKKETDKHAERGKES